jgi:PD-(D/E)XK nuclease superfamily
MPFWEYSGSAPWIFKTSLESIVKVFNGLCLKKETSLATINLDYIKEQGYVLDDNQARAYLFQTGYLTIVKWKEVISYSPVQLDFPNEFCGEFLLKCLYFEDISTVDIPILKLTREFVKNPCDETAKDYLAMKKQCFDNLARRSRTFKAECYFPIFFTYDFHLLHLETSAQEERQTNQGRCDLKVGYQDKTLVFEFKRHSKKMEKCDCPAKTLEQYHRDGYGADAKLKGNKVFFTWVCFAENTINRAGFLCDVYDGTLKDKPRATVEDWKEIDVESK